MEYILQTPAQLGPVVQGVRRSRKLTQAAAGAKVGLRQNAVSGMETNPGPTSLAQIFKLLSALNLELVVRDRKERPTVGW